MRPDLHELLADAIGDVPYFSPSDLAMRLRRRRQRQIGVVVGTAASAVALTIAVARPEPDRGFAVRIREGSTASTEPPSTGVTITTATTTTSTTTEPLTGSSTATTTTVPPPSPPQVGDFTGTLTVSPTTLAVGETAHLDLTIRNVTDHAIDLSPYLGTTWIGLNCDGEFDPTPGRSGVYYDGWEFPYEAIEPGATRELVADWSPKADDVGTTMYCAAAIVDAADTPVRFFPDWNAVTAIPSVEVTVLPGDGTTTTTTTSSVPTTTIPESTTVPTT
jgi:hypothetical protein